MAEPFAFKKLSDFLRSETDSGIIAEIDNIQTDVVIRFFKFWQFHIALF
jgi:hypothetical protein